GSGVHDQRPGHHGCCATDGQRRTPCPPAAGRLRDVPGPPRRRGDGDRP
ncbi:unnamed protein product, partial [Heterosigma akashiwo]